MAVEMSKFIIKGQLDFGRVSNFDRIIIVHPKSKWRMDLLGRLQELQLNARDNKIQFNYTISDTLLTDIELQENLIKKLAGCLDTDFSTYETGYSEYTSCTEYVSTLSIGGHDLMKELRNSKGKYIHIEVYYKSIFEKL